MKVFFDECVPRPLRRLLTGHEIYTAQEMGWGRLKNGELIRRAEENGFEAFVTSDKNLGYQQNLTGRQISLVVLSTNFWPVLQNHTAKIEAALATLQPRQYVEVQV